MDAVLQMNASLQRDETELSSSQFSVRRVHLLLHAIQYTYTLYQNARTQCGERGLTGLVELNPGFVQCIELPDVAFSDMIAELGLKILIELSHARLTAKLAHSEQLEAQRKRQRETRKVTVASGPECEDATSPLSASSEQAQSRLQLLKAELHVREDHAASAVQMRPRVVRSAPTQSLQQDTPVVKWISGLHWADDQQLRQYLGVSDRADLTSGCFAVGLSAWFRRVNLPPSWCDLVAALITTPSSVWAAAFVQLKTVSDCVAGSTTEAAPSQPATRGAEVDDVGSDFDGELPTAECADDRVVDLFRRTSAYSWDGIARFLFMDEGTSCLMSTYLTPVVDKIVSAPNVRVRAAILANVSKALAVFLVVGAWKGMDVVRTAKYYPAGSALHRRWERLASRAHRVRNLLKLMEEDEKYTQQLKSANNAVDSVPDPLVVINAGEASDDEGST